MKIKDLKAYNGKMVKIRTRHSVVRTGILEIINNDTIRIGNALLKPHVIEEIELIESVEDEK